MKGQVRCGSEEIRNDCRTCQKEYLGLYFIIHSSNSPGRNTDPLGSGRPSFCFKYFRRNMTAMQLVLPTIQYFDNLLYTSRV